VISFTLWSLLPQHILHLEVGGSHSQCGRCGKVGNWIP